MQNDSWLLGACAGVALAALGVFSCSSDFESCEDSRTCPEDDAGTGGSAGSGGSGNGGGAGKGGSGGSGGASGAAGSGGGEAGAAGGGGAPECTSDEECRDPLACNGLETCVEGRCQLGTAVECSNPDAAHCTVACVELDGSSMCSVAALDRDGDGHADADCSAAPGDDCDDSQPSVHAGAVEVCDGRDNDCNGREDIGDGLPVSGMPTVVVYSEYADSTPAVAWAADAGKYVFAWANGNTFMSTLKAAFVDTAGAVSGEVTVGGTMTYHAGPQLSWSPAGTAVVWHRRLSGGGWELMFQILDSNLQRQFTTDVVVDTIALTQPDFSAVTLTRLATGDWYVGWLRPVLPDAPLQARGRLFGTSGPVGSVFAPVSTQALRAAAFGQDLLLAEATATTARVRRLSSTLSPVDQYDVMVPGGAPSNVRAAVREDRIGLAWNVTGTRNVVQFAELNSAGQVACGPITILDTGTVDDVRAADNGYTLLVRRAGTSTGDYVLYRVPIGCGQPTSPIPIASGIYSPTVAGLAQGSGGFAVMWGHDVSTISARFMGPNFCD